VGVEEEVGAKPKVCRKGALGLLAVEGVESGGLARADRLRLLLLLLRNIMGAVVSGVGSNVAPAALTLLLS